MWPVNHRVREERAGSGNAWQIRFLRTQNTQIRERVWLSVGSPAWDVPTIQPLSTSNQRLRYNLFSLFHFFETMCEFILFGGQILPQLLYCFYCFHVVSSSGINISLSSLSPKKKRKGKLKLRQTVCHYSNFYPSAVGDMTELLQCLRQISLDKRRTAGQSQGSVYNEAIRLWRGSSRFFCPLRPVGSVPLDGDRDKKKL